LKGFDVGVEMGFNNDVGIGRIGCASGNQVDERENNDLGFVNFSIFFN
jgi:hypothetical protein